VTSAALAVIDPNIVATVLVTATTPAGLRTRLFFMAVTTLEIGGPSLPAGARRRNRKPGQSVSVFSAAQVDLPS